MVLTQKDLQLMLTDLKETLIRQGLVLLMKLASDFIKVLEIELNKITDKITLK